MPTGPNIDKPGQKTAELHSGVEISKAGDGSWQVIATHELLDDGIVEIGATLTEVCQYVIAEIDRRAKVLGDVKKSFRRVFADVLGK